MSDQPPAPPPPPSGPPTPPPSGGAPPPPPPSDNPYGGAPPPSAYSPVDAMTYGWKKFQASPATLLVPVLLAVVAVAVVYALMFFVILGSAMSGGGVSYNPDGTIRSIDTGPGFVVRLVLMGIVILVVVFAMQILMAALAKGGLEVADGRSPSLGQLFEGWDKTQVVIAAVLIAIGTGIGSILCYLPGLAFAFLTSYAMLFVIDQRMGAVDAIKASISFTTSHLGETILFFLLSAVVSAIGAVLCGVGLLVAYPVVLVAQAYTFRTLRGEPVSPV